ncbi:MAG TPA: family 10 glycosylhydrolase, partial [Eudoraea sp.]|nr:family 10 glycosylhydrolase [Eudoraea sp.]
MCLSSCGIFKATSPPPKYEFRGVWIATVVNIDWPKHPSDTWEKQKADYLKLLNFYQNLNLNAVIVQIRTAGDAFYPSAYAPWSRFLTGTEGVAPETDEDPLQWMINEAHSRGLEFHAWLNPYRATFDLNLDVLSEIHDFYKHPGWMLKYGKKYYYDPGLPEVRQYLVRIMQEVVTNYDVDALHFDDYFYPYKIQGEVLSDSQSYASHALPGQTLQDWRRSNVDSLIKNVQQGIKKVKPWVRFGISPFGVWKNNSTDPRGSATRAGQTTYEDLYADPLLWMDQGWIDYLVPQVYWSMNLPVASHEKIVNWWANDSIASNLYIGNAAYKIRNNPDKAWKKKKELPNQLKLARSTSKVQGNVLFS